MKSIRETFANEVIPTMTTKMDLEVFANELVECVQGKSVYEVIYIHRYIVSWKANVYGEKHTDLIFCTKLYHCSFQFNEII